MSEVALSEMRCVDCGGQLTTLDNEGFCVWCSVVHRPLAMTQPTQAIDEDTTFVTDTLVEEPYNPVYRLNLFHYLALLCLSLVTLIACNGLLLLYTYLLYYHFKYPSSSSRSKASLSQGLLVVMLLVSLSPWGFFVWVWFLWRTRLTQQS